MATGCYNTVKSQFRPPPPEIPLKKAPKGDRQPVETKNLLYSDIYHELKKYRLHFLHHL